MSSVVIKLGSLVIRTLSKPIANKIKDQARQHERFRQVCIKSAQAIHRWDMRFKLGLLQDSATQEKQAKREAAEAQAAKHKHEAPTVKTEAQTQIDEDRQNKEKEREEKGEKKQKETAPPKPKVKIRPLSEAKAIDSGANFVSETFLLLVGVALILGENWRQNRKQKTRREDVAERLEELEIYERKAREGMVALETEVLRLRGENVRLEGENKKKGVKQPRILPPEVYELEEKEQKERQPREKQGLWEWIRTNAIGDWKKADNPETSRRDVPRKSEAASVIQEAASTSTSPRSSSILSRILPSTDSTSSSQTSNNSREEAMTKSNSEKNHASDARPTVR